MNIKTYKTKEEYVKEIQTELIILFRKMGYEQDTYLRWLDTTTKIATEKGEVISYLCERLMQGGIVLYPYKFDASEIPQGFNAHIKDDEVDGLLSISNKELEEYSGATYFKRFLEGFKVAKEKFS